MVLRSLLDGQLDQRLPMLAVDDHRVAKYLEVDEPLLRVERGNPLPEVADELVLVELPALEPEESLGLRLHRPGDLLVAHPLVAVDAHARHREAAPFVDANNQL